MARITIELVGRTPLLCHNIVLADPDNPITKEIAVLTGKRKKTEEDRRAIERLEWYGGLYTAAGFDGPVMPTQNIRKCLIQAAKQTRQGTAVQRALIFVDLVVPLVYPGTRDIDALFADAAYTNRASVGIQAKRLIRVRPQFPEWSVVAEAELLTDVMDLNDLCRVADFAGLAEGIGDNRVNGFGKFTVTVKS